MKRPPLTKNPIRFLPGRLVEMQLNHGRVTIFDLADLPQLAPIRWYATAVGRGPHWYVAGYDPGCGRVLMHRLVCAGRAIDHKNTDTFDNRRENLREATHSQNGANARMRKDNPTGFKGVVKRPQRRFQMRITVRGRVYRKGGFVTAEAAARAYDAMAMEHFGEFARLNFPKPSAVRSA